MPVLPGAEPFSHDGDDVGVLLCHGFTGTPQSLRPWAEHLAAAGRTVRLPRLPGHGTTWQEMNRTGWQDWYATVDAAFAEMHASCRLVFCAGLSMGGALALRLAEQHGADVAGLVLVNPAVHVPDGRLVALPVLRHVVPSLAGVGNDIKLADVTELAYDRTPLHALASMLRMYAGIRADLPKVTQPLLLFRSTEDHIVHASSSALVLDRVSSTDVEETLCEDSYHVATLDNDAPRIFEGSARFIARVAGDRRTSSSSGTTIETGAPAAGMS